MDSYKILGVPEDITLPELRAHWIKVRSKHHPDKGGNADTFAEMLKAYYDIWKKLNKAIECPECLGGGVVAKGAPFKLVRTVCPECNGTGLIRRAK